MSLNKRLQILGIIILVVLILLLVGKITTPRKTPPVRPSPSVSTNTRGIHV